MADTREYVDRWFPYLDESARLIDHMEDESTTNHGDHAVDIDGFENGYDAATSVTMEDSVFANHLTDAHLTHCHPQLQPQRDRRAEKTLIIVSMLTVVFIVLEFAGGYFANSLAIMTDAGHMLSDLLSFLISLFAIYVARRPATMRLSFGFYRAEILGAVCSIFIIWILTGILVYMAIMRVIHQDFEVNADPMLITAGVGVFFNILMGAVLHYGGHGHSHFGGGSHSHGGGHSHGDGHGHSHENGHHDHDHERAQQTSMASHESSTDDTIVYRRPSVASVPIRSYPNEEVSSINRQRNINVRAAFVHVIGDLVQSVGVMIAALVIKFTHWKLADPICTFVFSILVLITTMTVMRDAVIVLMEGTPRDVNYSAVKSDLQKIKGVRAAHSLHMWSLTMDKAALAVHLAIDSTEDALKIMQKANRMMRYKYNVAFTTVQVEPFDVRFMTSCEQCVGPIN